MTWLAFGWYIGVAFGSMMVPKAHSILKQRTALMVVSMRVAFSVPAIGGVVVVGQMIKEYGDCKRL